MHDLYEKIFKGPSEGNFDWGPILNGKIDTSKNTRYDKIGNVNLQLFLANVFMSIFPSRIGLGCF